MARDLRASGAIDERRMLVFDALCLHAPDDMPPEAIRALRERIRISQDVLAAILNTSVSTVQNWERGVRKPSGPSLRLLNLIDRKGLEALL